MFCSYLGNCCLARQGVTHRDLTGSMSWLSALFRVSRGRTGCGGCPPFISPWHFIIREDSLWNSLMIACVLSGQGTLNVPAHHMRILRIRPPLTTQRRTRAWIEAVWLSRIDNTTGTNGLFKENIKPAYYLKKKNNKLSEMFITRCYLWSCQYFEGGPRSRRPIPRPRQESVKQQNRQSIGQKFTAY